MEPASKASFLLYDVGGHPEQSLRELSALTGITPVLVKRIWIKGHETNSVFIVSSEKLYKKVKAQNLDSRIGARLSRYVYDHYDYPFKGKDFKLFIKIPSCLNKNQARYLLEKRIEILINFSILKEGQYSLRFPVGDHPRFCFLEFDPLEVSVVFRRFFAMQNWDSDISYRLMCEFNQIKTKPVFQKRVDGKLYQDRRFIPQKEIKMIK